MTLVELVNKEVLNYLEDGEKWRYLFLVIGIIFLAFSFINLVYGFFGLALFLVAGFHFYLGVLQARFYVLNVVLDLLDEMRDKK